MRSRLVPSKSLLVVSVACYVAGLLLPAVDLVPWARGLSVAVASFTGSIIGLMASPTHWIACLLGASANILLIVTGRRIWGGSRSPGMSATAFLLTCAAAVPMISLAQEGTAVLGPGYYLWVSSAAAIVFASYLVPERGGLEAQTSFGV